MIYHTKCRGNCERYALEHSNDLRPISQRSVVLLRTMLQTQAQRAQKRAQRPPRDTNLKVVYVRMAMMVIVSESSIHEMLIKVGPKPP